MADETRNASDAANRQESAGVAGPNPNRGWKRHMTTHVTEVAKTTGISLWYARCSCGWQAEYTSSDPEDAERDALNHERANGGQR